MRKDEHLLGTPLQRPRYCYWPPLSRPCVPVWPNLIDWAAVDLGRRIGKRRRLRSIRATLGIGLCTARMREARRDRVPARRQSHAAIASAPVSAGTVTRDDAGPVLKMCAAEERWCAAPRELDLSALAGHSKDLGLRDGLDEGNKITPLCLRFLMLVTGGSAEGSWFPLRSPVKGKEQCRLGSIGCLLGSLPFCRSLLRGGRFPAQGCVSGRPLNRSLGDGVDTARGSMVTPFIFASISCCNASWITVAVGARGRNCRSAA